MPDEMLVTSAQETADELADPLRHFTQLERQVIALAAASSWECAGVSRNPFLRFLNGLARSLDRDMVARPLANQRLEALRRIACVSFASDGNPPADRVEHAVASGVSADQVRALSVLATRQGSAG
jgi:PIN domain nuclease of toxin-antitoxin system